MSDTILYQLEGGVATITLNRPDRYNAFVPEMNEALILALKAAKKDPAVRVLVITGAGEKAFCSGQDVKSTNEDAGLRSLGDSVKKRYNPIIKLMRSIPKPIIGRINGVAAGAGCSIALACDMTVAADHVRLIEVFINIGLVLDSGSSYFLPRLIGSSRAFEMATMGTKVSAQQALDWGLLNRVVPLDQLDDEVKKLSDYFAQAPTQAIGQIKKMLNKSAHFNLEEMLQYEAEMQEIAGRSADYKEGVNAFNEKRKPVFKGN